MESTGLVKYDSMVKAIESAYAVDEVKDIRDKSIALQAYFRQAKNTEAERRACEIRLRAERKAGVLLKKMNKAAPRGSNQHGKKEVSQATTLADFGISRDQSSKWQQLADIPEKDFEQALGGVKPPSTAGLLRTKKKKPKMDPKALWLWGRLRDFENQGILDSDSEELLSMMTEAMQADVIRLAGLVSEWLEGLSNGN